MVSLQTITLCAATVLCTLIHSDEPDFITYDWLAICGINTGHTDHIPHFRKLFNSFHVRGFLECGCGFSTKYFIENSDWVSSIEFITANTSDAWLQKCIDLYKNYPTWTPIAYPRSASLDKAAAYQCATHRDYALVDGSYQEEMTQFFKKLIADAALQGHPIDVGFVDPGIFLHGDMVKALLANRVPIVIAHSTYSDVGTTVNEGLYGWFKVSTPPDYEKIPIPWGGHTTFWIHHSLPHVINAISVYRDRVAERRTEHPEDYSYEPLTAFADE